MLDDVFPVEPGPVRYLFVDGECLRRVREAFADRYFDCSSLPVDWQRVRNHARKVFYYDAVPVQKHNEEIADYETRVGPKREELAQIENEAGFHVRSGDARHRAKRGHEQKMVDVKLTVDALLGATRGTFSRATLITGDLDFKPLIDALVDLGVDVTLQYPVGETNRELISAADQAQALSSLVLLEWSILPALKPRWESGYYEYLEGRHLVHSWERPGEKLRLYRESNLFSLYAGPPERQTATWRIVAPSIRALRAFGEDAKSMVFPENMPEE